jgi:hypothetical protein
MRISLSAICVMPVREIEKRKGTRTPSAMGASGKRALTVTGSCDWWAALVQMVHDLSGLFDEAVETGNTLRFGLIEGFKAHLSVSGARLPLACPKVECPSCLATPPC